MKHDENNTGRILKKILKKIGFINNAQVSLTANLIISIVIVVINFCELSYKSKIHFTILS